MNVMLLLYCLLASLMLERTHEVMQFARALELFFSGPKLTIEPLVVDLGQSEPGYLKGRVHFRNAGEDTLRFRRISSNTGAMIAVPTRDVLGPGDTTTLYITYDGYNKAFGTFRKSIYIETNEVIVGRESNSFKYYVLPVIGTICARGELHSPCGRKR
jgi:hypothetical protein